MVGVGRGWTLRSDGWSMAPTTRATDARADQRRSPGRRTGRPAHGDGNTRPGRAPRRSTAYPGRRGTVIHQVADGGPGPICPTGSSVGRRRTSPMMSGDLLHLGLVHARAWPGRACPPGCRRRWPGAAGRTGWRSCSARCPTSSQAASASAPVIPIGRRSTSARCESVPPRDDAQALLGERRRPAPGPCARCGARSRRTRAAMASCSATAFAAMQCSSGPPCIIGNTALSMAFACSARHRMIAPRGPRRVLCVVNVTTSAYGTGDWGTRRRRPAR